MLLQLIHLLPIVIVVSGRHRLEPPDGRSLHCAGQSTDAFAKYSHFMKNSSDSVKPVPAVYMIYTGLNSFNSKGDGVKWFKNLNSTFASYGKDQWLIPQIGLALPHGNDLADIGKGKYDVAISELTAGLLAFRRPALVRVGYEFNGPWNNYPSEDYKVAWKKIVKPWRSHAQLNDIAAIWDFACDVSGERLKWEDWYPGDETVDWWGVNIFSGDSAADGSCVANYVAAAKKAGYPVILGESTPRGYGVLTNSYVELQPKNVSSTLCVGVSDASTDEGKNVVLWSCGKSKKNAAPTGGSNQWWYFYDDGTVVDFEGLCLTSANASGYVVTYDCTWHGAKDVDRWSLTSNGKLKNTGSGECIKADGSAKEGAKLATVDCKESSALRWESVEINNTDGNHSWKKWFDPYLTLVKDQTVKGFCYINWDWGYISRKDTFNWYDWGDCRLDRSDAQLVGGKWRTALAKGEEFIHGVNRSKLCELLNCTQ